MKLVLASQGFTTSEIAEAVAELVKKPLDKINIAIINEAYIAIDEGRDQRWMIRELSSMANYIGGDIYFVNLRAYNREEIKTRLSHADLIYIVGGKQFVLPALFKETGTDEILKELAEEKVIMGTSAGAGVLGKQIESEEYWEKKYHVSCKNIKEKELGLINFNIIPHYGREDRQEWTKEELEKVLTHNPFPVYAVTDTQAVIYEEGTISFVGGMPDVFGNS